MLHIFRIKLAIFAARNPKRAFVLFGLVRACIVFASLGCLALLSVLVYPGTVTVAGEIRPIIHRRVERWRFNRLTNNHFLEDFNYLMTALEENWPFFDLSISVNDVDVHELADALREKLSDPNYPIDGAVGFQDLIRAYFIRPIDRLGHLRTYFNYENFFNAHDNWTAEWLRWFEDHGQAWHTFHGVVPQMPEMETNLRTLFFFEALRDAGGSSLVPIPIPGAPSVDLPFYEYDFLADNIGYLLVRRMFGLQTVAHDVDYATADEQYSWMLQSFFEQAVQRGAEHLIIDLRGNPGGHTHHFDENVLQHLTTIRRTLPAYVFHLDGSYTMDVLQEDMGLTMPLREQQRVMDLMYTGSDQVFSTAFRSRYYIPARSAQRAENNLLFEGKVWVLVDENTTSGAEAAAAIIGMNNMGTLVGTYTRGMFGTSYDSLAATVVLPHTGIQVRIDIAYFTDRQGRPLQGYGIRPHYGNLPGMDALQTVLYMIEGRN